MMMNELIQNHLSTADEPLKKIIQLLPFPQVKSTQNVLHDLLSCIIEQQIHYRSTKKTFAKLLATADLQLLSLENFAVFEEKGLSKVKLSTRKYETVLAILDFFSQNPLNWRQLSDYEVRQQLAQIKGVGNWTIEMILIYTLERPNIFPADDYHLKQIMTALYELNPNATLKPQLRAIAQNWSPYQSFAVKYLLDWKSFQKKTRT